MQEFKVTRIYTDLIGETHFEDISYPLNDAGPIGHLSKKISVSQLMFRKVPPDYDDFHNAPAKQLVVLLNGAVEIETSLGVKRVFNSGEVLLMEDVDGKGHRSRNVERSERSSLFITLTDKRIKFKVITEAKYFFE